MNPFLQLCVGALVGLLPLAAPAEEVPTSLQEYLAKPQAKARWSIIQHGRVDDCELWHLTLTSQVWQGLPWNHDLLVFRPEGAALADKLLLLNDAGSYREERVLYGAELAKLSKAPVAILLGVPKQPLFGGQSEDHLIAETFVRFLATEDASWPLLFPMVKSVVAAMDALQAFAQQEWQAQLDGFIVSGASKRGWTAWLTAAADPRVTAVAPMVIDLLNIPLQVPHQISRFGTPSSSISPYTARKLVPLQDTPQARKLWRMVDPWSYRSKLTMPKMIVLANNDPYWSTDALNLYWEGLPGEKYLSYTANAGHNLAPVSADGRRSPPLRALNNIAAFVRAHLNGQPMPKLNWTHDVAPDGRYRITIQAEPKPHEGNLWIATSPTQDFREARWEKSGPLEIGDRTSITAHVPRPESGYVAFYADLGYWIDEIPLRLCTQLRLAGNPAE